MTESALIPLQAARELPIPEVGVEAHFLSRLFNAGCPLSPSLVVTTSTVKKLQLNHPTTKQLFLKKYHTFFNDNYVSIRPLSLDEQLPTNPGIPQENIKGDMNLLQTTQELIQKNPNLPLLITITPQPQVSGKAWSSHPHTHRKTEILLHSTWGVYQEDSLRPSDEFVINLRSQSVIENTINPKTITQIRTLDGLETEIVPDKLQNKPTLVQEQAVIIAQSIHFLKQHCPTQIEVEWYIENHQLFITSIKPIDQSHHSEISLNNPYLKPLVKGVIIEPGFVTAHAQVVSSSTEAKQFITGSILVIKDLSNQHTTLIKEASAIITEKPLTSNQAKSLIQKFHIPCIAQAKGITSQIRSGEQLVLDAQKGIVYQTHQPVSTIHHQTKSLPMVAFTQNSFNLTNSRVEDADEILITNDLAISLLGEHPFHLLNSQPDLLKKHLKSHLDKALRVKPQLWYRLTSLSSQKLHPLNHGDFYETPEVNPYLGHKGALRLLSYPPFLNLELELLEYILKNNHQPLRVVIPWARTTTEVLLLLNQLQNWQKNHRKSISIWVEINTPAMVKQVKSLVREGIDGFIFSAKNIHNLSVGLDPENHEVLLHYPFDVELTTSYLEQLFLNTDNQKPIYLQHLDFHPQLLANAVHLGIAGAICLPQHTSQTKRVISEKMEKKTSLYG